MRRIGHIVLLATVVAALAAPSALAAADWRQAIRDCATDGRLHQHYSRSVLEQAIKHLPPDINEYTDCYDVLRAALAGPGGGLTGRGVGSPGAALGAPSASDLQQLKDLTHGHAPSVSVGGRPLAPAGISLASMSAANRLPGPLVWSLIALGASAAAAALVALRDRLPGLRRLPARLLRRR